MTKVGLGTTLILLPLFIVSMFFTSMFLDSQSYDKPRSYTRMVTVGEAGTCSSVVIAPNLVLTAFHCTGTGESKTLIKVDGKEATLLRYDRDNDLALLYAEVGCPCSPIAPESPEVDDNVLAVGFPLGLAKVATEGKANGLVTYDDKHYKTLSTNHLIFGNSGGGLYQFTLGEWQLVGLTVATPGVDLGYMGIPSMIMALSVPIETIRHFLYRT